MERNKVIYLSKYDTYMKTTMAAVVKGTIIAVNLPDIKRHQKHWTDQSEKLLVLTSFVFVYFLTNGKEDVLNLLKAIPGLTLSSHQHLSASLLCYLHWYFVHGRSCCSVKDEVPGFLILLLRWDVCGSSSLWTWFRIQLPRAWGLRTDGEAGGTDKKLVHPPAGNHCLDDSQTEQKQVQRRRKERKVPFKAIMTVPLLRVSGKQRGLVCEDNAMC